MVKFPHCLLGIRTSLPNMVGKGCGVLCGSAGVVALFYTSCGYGAVHNYLVVCWL